MITDNLAELIRSGKAQSQTLVYGGGGVGRIHVPKNQFVIIHHFDYWHFIDLPAIGEEDAPAVGSLYWTYNSDAPNTYTGNIALGPVTLMGVTVDEGDDVATVASIQAQLDISLPGWTVAVITSGNTYQLEFTTVSPGAEFNGYGLGFFILGPISPVINQIPFAGGESDDPLPYATVLSRAAHQLSFRSKKSRNIFAIQEPLEVSSMLGGGFIYNCVGKYQKDCYLVHDQSVQINVLGIPDVDLWAVTMNTLGPESRETKRPEGYGQGAAGDITVREIIFDAAGNTQQYLPLTSYFDDTAAIPFQNRNEFKVDSILYPLENPKNKGGLVGNFKTYPLVNIDYLLVNMNIDEFVKSSG